MSMVSRRKNDTPRERMFREAFLPDRKSRKPLLVREKPSGTGIGWGMRFLWATLICVTVFTVFFSDFHVLRTVEIRGTKDVSTEKVEAFVRDRLSGRILYIFPRDNFFAVPSASIEEDLLREFPKFRHVSLSRRFPDALSVEVTERDRLPLWCTGPSCFLLDETGRLSDARFAETPENEPFLIRIVDDGGTPAMIGETVMSSEAVASVLLLEESLRNRSGGIAIVGQFHSPSRVSDEVRVATSEGWDILASLDIAPEKTVASLRLVLEREIPVERRLLLRYVDLRTENRAFFSFRQEEVSTEDATEAGASDKAEAKKDGHSDE